ncbi:TRAP transporter substrate-binding protein [Absicoccus porci]|mgnify:CR=1 FL=1|jgi:tripartite ATP-independent transporter DctP family solute receptor|uniref:TRAP transporter substrate-binding protein n=1 Tax=Absicoccus porci TaxID=2486576 RepID=UPI003D920BAF
MKRLKKLTALVVSGILSLSLAGCGTQASTGTQRYAWPLGTSSPEDTVTQIYAEKFAEEVLKLSHGKMKIQVYPNSVLGGDRELLESQKDGDIPFVVQNTAPQVTFMPDIAVFDMPRVYNDINLVRTAIDDPEFMAKIQKVYNKGGYELLGYADQGFRVMSTNKKIASIDDFKGQKIRTMENSYHMMFWKQLGASPTPMTFSEVYIGLQQGTIDAQENPYEVIVSNKLYEQQDYVVETNHLPHLISLTVSSEFMKSLPKNQQKIIRQAAQIAKEYARKQSDKRIASRIQTIKDSGTQIITLDSATQAEMDTRSEKVYEAIEKQVDASLVRAYMKEANR